MATQRIADVRAQRAFAPRAACARVTTYREDLITMPIAIWPIVAMFFDGRSHNNETGQESFWSHRRTCSCTAA